MDDLFNENVVFRVNVLYATFKFHFLKLMRIVS